MVEIYVVDLFCGCGGFSEGARKAGASTILAVDNWKDALDVHKKNHPGTVHWNFELGGDIKAFAHKLNNFLMEMNTTGKHIHVHSSPPCQNLSRVNANKNMASGILLVEWSLDLMKYLNLNTWSIEQVPCKEITNIVSGDDLFFKYVRTDAIGVPNKRGRYILSNFEIKWILCDEGQVSTLKNILDDIGETCGYSFQTNGTYRDRQYTYKCIDTVSYTVTSQFPCLYDKTMGRRSLSIRALKRLQSFDEGYDISCKFISDKRKMIANSVPPLLAKMIIQSLY